MSLRWPLLLLAVAAVVAGCASTDRRLDKVQWGEEMDGDYDAILDRTRFVLRKMYPKGLDPDRTDEERGEFYTVWDYRISTFNRETTRSRARVSVQAVSPGRVRVGAAVVQQLSDNIDNPGSVEEARWVGTQNDVAKEKLILDRVRQPYLDLKPSEYFEEKHRSTPRKTLRPDLVDRSKDVDLDPDGSIDPDRTSPTIVGEDSYRQKREKEAAEEKKAPK